MKAVLAISLLLAFATLSVFAQKSAEESGYISTDDGTRLFYQKIGNGKEFVIIPGGLFTFKDFRNLASGDRTLVFYDMRGRGRSGIIPDDRRAQLVGIHHDVKDVERIRRYFGASRFSIIGYSYLGLMSIMAAMEYPDRIVRAVQIGPVPLKYGTEYPKEYTNTDKLADIGAPAADIAELERMRAEGHDKSKPKEFCLQSWRVNRYRLVGNPANVEALGPGLCKMPNEYPVNLAKHFEYSFTSVQKLDIPRERVAAVKIPVLTIHGTKDRNAAYGSGREWASILPNARLFTVNGGAHQVWIDEPKVISMIARFLRGRWPDGVERVK